MLKKSEYEHWHFWEQILSRDIQKASSGVLFPLNLQDLQFSAGCHCNFLSEISRFLWFLCLNWVNTCRFVCRCDLMTFDAFMADVTKVWKPPKKQHDFMKFFRFKTPPLRRPGLISTWWHPLCSLIMLKGPSVPSMSQREKTTAVTDHSFTQGEGLKRVVFSREGISTLI